MASSPTMAAHGLVGGQRAGWRSGAAAAVTVVSGRPYLWLLGALGFCLRGGILILTLPIVVLPTQVEVRLLLGSHLGSTGLTADFMRLAALGGLFGLALALVALLVVAYVELVAYETLMRDPETAEQRNWLAPRTLVAGRRRALLLLLFAIQLATLLAVVVSSLPLVNAVMSATLVELLRPTSGMSIYMRVLGAVREPLFVLIAAFVFIEMISAVASRQLLAAGYGLASRPANGRFWLLRAIVAATIMPLRSPLRIIGTALLGWVLAIAALLPVGWAMTVAWQQVRGSFLTSAPIGDPPQLVGVVLVSVLLATVFALGMLLAGFASALRAGLWSLESLR